MIKFVETDRETEECLKLEKKNEISQLCLIVLLFQEFLFIPIRFDHCGVSCEIESLVVNQIWESI